MSNISKVLSLFASCIILITLSSCTSSSKASEEAQDFAQWAETQALPILSTDIHADSSDLAGITGLVREAKIVAVGETAHNVQQQLEIRSRFFTYLVEELGFRLLAVETSMPHAERINAYVLGGEGDVDELLWQSGTWQLMANSEMRTTIEWIRQYNSSVTNGDFVQFYGLDISTPLPALTSLEAYLNQVDPDLADSFSAPFSELHILLSQEGDETWRTLEGRYDEALEAQLDELINQLQTLQVQLESAEPAYVAASSQKEYDQALRWAAVLARGHEMFAIQASTGSPNSPERILAVSEIRDPAMADNALWILDQNPGQTMVLWANNLHIHRSDPDRVFSVGKQFELRGTSTIMGSDLDAALGSSYVVIHATLHSGETGDYGQLSDVSGDSLDGALNLVGPEMFYLDIRTIPQDRLGGAWIRSLQSMRAESGMLTVTPTTSFDIVYFVSSGNSAHELP